MRRPFRRSSAVCALGRQPCGACLRVRPAVVVARRPRFVPGEAQEDVVEAGLAQREAGRRGCAAASRARRTSAPTAGPFVDRQLDQRLSTTAFLRPRAARGAERRRRLLSRVAEGHRDDRGPEVGLQLGRRALGDDVPVVDHHDVAGQAVGLFEVLGGEQHGRALAHQLLDHGPEVLRLCGSRPVVGSSRNRTGGWRRGRRPGRAAAHAARVGLEDPVAGVGQAECLEQLVGPRADGACGSGGRAGRPCGCSRARSGSRRPRRTGRPGR